MPKHNAVTDLRRRHSVRFRALGGERYPRQVAEAYDLDLARAAADSDGQVAAKVATWECQQGLPVTDWWRIHWPEDVE